MKLQHLLSFAIFLVLLWSCQSDDSAEVKAVTIDSNNPLETPTRIALESALAEQSSHFQDTNPSSSLSSSVHQVISINDTTDLFIVGHSVENERGIFQSYDIRKATPNEVGDPYEFGVKMKDIRFLKMNEDTLLFSMTNNRTDIPQTDTLAILMSEYTLTEVSE